MKILLVNHFTPPDESPTARLLSELGDGLAAKGWEVSHAGAAQGYHTRKKVRGWRRWMRDIVAHGRIMVALFSSPKPDWILCLSDPPGLVFTTAVVAALRGSRLAHWAMDVYPEIALALGEVKSGSIARCVTGAMAVGYRRCRLLVALDGDMADLLHAAYGVQADILPPWAPLAGYTMTRPLSPAAPRAGRWLYSGNLGRAHDYETALNAQRLLEDRGVNMELVFQGGGPAVTAAQALASSLGLQHCHWQGYADKDELLATLARADVLVATQKKETKGMLWPSKMALMSLIPRPIVWIGPEDGATARLVQRHTPASIAVACGDAERLADWLEARLQALPAIPAGIVSADDVRNASRAQHERAVEWWHARLSA